MTEPLLTRTAVMPMDFLHASKGTAKTNTILRARATQNNGISVDQWKGRRRSALRRRGVVVCELTSGRSGGGVAGSSGGIEDKVA